MIGWLTAALIGLFLLAVVLVKSFGAFAGFGIGMFILCPAIFVLQWLLAHLFLRPK